MTGAGGSGKSPSRPARRVGPDTSGDEHPDRPNAGEEIVAWWIDLDALAAESDIAEHVATEIGVVARRDSLAEVERRLQGRRSLLVFDHAEHVADATAMVVVDLLTRCPDVRALVDQPSAARRAGRGGVAGDGARDAR